MFPVDAFRNTLGKAVAIFERHSIRFHLTGGITSVLYGEPRMTQDIDIVIDNQAAANDLDALLGSLEASDFMYEAQVVRDAVARGDLFQLFDNEEALKLDIYPRELIRGELDRSETAEVFEGVRLPIVSRADAAASKLVWISKGSHKSRRDLRQICRNADAKHGDQIRELAKQLKLEPLLDEVLNEPDEIDGS